MNYALKLGLMMCYTSTWYTAVSLIKTWFTAVLLLKLSTLLCLCYTLKLGTGVLHSKIYEQTAVTEGNRESLI